jgi:mono/diheme cytochrome c family protein
MRLRTFAFVPVLAAGLLYGQGEKSPASGEAIFRLRCGGCHGLDGRAQTAIGKKHGMRDLTSASVQAQTDADLTRAIANGRGRMPAYEMILGPERIQAVVAYLREMGR